MSLLPRKNSERIDSQVVSWWSSSGILYDFFSFFGLHVFSKTNMICLWNKKSPILFKCLNMNLISPKKQWRDKQAGEARLLLLPTRILPPAALPEGPPSWIKEKEKGRGEENPDFQCDWDPVRTKFSHFYFPGFFPAIAFLVPCHLFLILLRHWQ